MKSWRRLFHILPGRDKSTRVVFKRLTAMFCEAAQNLETYFPDLPRTDDGISDEAFGAFFGSTCVQLQIGSSEIGWGKDEPCSMRHLATQAAYSIRHFFRIQHALIELGYKSSDHEKKGVPTKREYTPKFWASVKPLLQKYFKDVPKDWKDQEKISAWINQLIQKGRDYLAALEISRRRAEDAKTPRADPQVQAAHMRSMREILRKDLIPRGRGGGDPAPAV